MRDEWDDITRDNVPKGLRRDPATTIAWRQHAKGRPVAELTINGALMRALGWEAGATRVLILAAKDRSRIALRPDDAGKKLRRTNGASGVLAHHLQWVRSERRPAEIAQHEIAGDRLILRLPDWAREGDGRAIPLEPVPAAETVAAAPAPPEDGPGAEDKRDRLTPERETLFRQLWPDQRKSVSEVAAAMNRLPGRPYDNPTSMYWVAKRLGLERVRGGQAGAAAARQPKESWHETDEREAEGLVRGSPDVWGAKAIAEEYGWRLDVAQRFVARVREAMAREQLAARGGAA